MADDVERTEDPTPKRRIEARRKGQIPVSTEIFTVANFLAVTLTLMLLGMGVLQQGMAAFQQLWIPRESLDPTSAAHLLKLGFGAAGGILLPILGAAFAAAILAGVAQTKGNFSVYKLKPQMSKLNPMKNASRIIKKQAVFELPKSLIKVAIIGSVIYFVIAHHLPSIPGLSRLPLIQIVSFQMKVVLQAYLAGALALLVIAAADYAHQRWQVEKSLKMTKTQIREERRQSEGDPHVKAQQRSRQEERARTRMMQAVPKADVVVTNPDHISVALVYKRAETPAPKVVAKGAGFIAQRIRELATASGIPIVENRVLARTLYRSVKVGQMVPEKLYKAVAEVLAYVYRLDREKARAW